MRISYILDVFPKRSETFVRDEVEWMARHGRLDRIFTRESELEALDEISQDVLSRIRILPMPQASLLHQLHDRARWLAHQPKIFFTRLKARSMSRESFENFVLARRLVTLLNRETPPDLLHVHFAGRAAQIARYASRLSGIPFTFCAHHYDIFHMGPPNFPLLAADARRIQTISEYNRRYMVDVLRLPGEKIQVLHCGIDPNRFDKPSPRKRQAQARDPFTIVSVGRLVEMKAQHFMIEACRLLVDRGYNPQLRLIGDGPMRNSLERLIVDLELTNYVALLGAQSSSAVRDELRAAHAFAMSSLSEGIPVALMEAMASELPVITTGVRGIPELVEHESCGLIVPEGDAHGLAEAMARLADDSTLRLLLGRAARERILEDFNATTQYEKLWAFWQEAAA